MWCPYFSLFLSDALHTLAGCHRVYLESVEHCVLSFGALFMHQESMPGSGQKDFPSPAQHL